MSPLCLQTTSSDYILSPKFSRHDQCHPLFSYELSKIKMSLSISEETLSPSLIVVLAVSWEASEHHHRLIVILLVYLLIRSYRRSRDVMSLDEHHRFRPPDYLTDWLTTIDILRPSFRVSFPQLVDNAYLFGQNKASVAIV